MNLIQEICHALKTASIYFRDNPYNGTGWTAEVHGRIGDLAERYAAAQGIGLAGKGPPIGGKRLSVLITGGSPPATGSQFIFDQCWLIYHENNEEADGYTTKCALAMETEWLQDSEEINIDFLKLVVAKADVKIMVCIGRDQTSCKAISNELIKQVELFDRNAEGDEAYIFGIYCLADRNLNNFVKRGSHSVAPYPDAV